VTLIQRFGSALNLNIHFHMILLGGVYVPVEGAQPVFRHLPAPTATELGALVQQIAERIGKTLERRGLVERDMENAWLAPRQSPNSSMRLVMFADAAPTLMGRASRAAARPSCRSRARSD
jgi:Putative transposase